MSKEKYRLLIVTSHPIQYDVPVFRLMAQHPKLDILVAYCSLQGSKPGLDTGFGIEVKWDIPLLDGYPWVELPNQSWKPGISGFFALVNFQLWKLIRRDKFDAVVMHTGYSYASSWIGIIATKTSGIPLLFGTDAHQLNPRDKKFWKISIKKWLLPKIFRIADTVMVHSSGAVKFMDSLRIPKDNVQLVPFIVDNEWWIAQSQQVNRALVRQQWGIPQDAPLVLFCAKLQAWKRPQDVLQAFAKANVPSAYLVLAGEGPLREFLETEAKSLKILDQVKFLGFVNQSQLPSVYTAADLFVLPSEHEPFGVVVNEAMLCNCAVVVSNQVGARYDLIREGETGFVYPCGDIEALTKILQKMLTDKVQLSQMGKMACQQMEHWSPRDRVEAVIQGIEKALVKLSK
ncbi:MAG: glycosyltransferase family 4 protein [Aphanizomenon sp.]|jgi:glycosyltransferase involved in cell wall biosynthesis